MLKNKNVYGPFRPFPPQFHWPVLLKKGLLFLFFIFFFSSNLYAQSPEISFAVSMNKPASHTFQVKMIYRGLDQSYLYLQLPEWTPGYYQLLHFPKFINHFSVTSANGKNLVTTHPNEYSWKIETDHSKKIIVTYDVQTTRQFVATPYLDKEHAYIIPGALFMHPRGKTDIPVQVTIHPYKAWHDITTGLDKIKGKKYLYYAPNYNVLYDSPLLIGNLQSLPSFTVQGVSHYFIGYKMADLDHQKLMDDLKKIVEASVKIIGDIPYKHYTFIGIGPGQGGIEHLNSTTISFTGKGLNNPKTLLKMLFFLAHEYFHNFNVKRIRPIELGPFDYEHRVHTKLLWIAEGITVYYENMTVKRAGLCSEQELLNAFHQYITTYQHNPGRFFQTLEQSSYETWSDGPFGKTGGYINKAISYYQKGPIVGLMLNFKIQHATHNQKSLDDVMRILYNKFYKQKGRGFTQTEFRQVAEQVAGTNLDEIWSYISTTKKLDYNKYFNYAGYQVDTTAHIVPGGWTGITVSSKQNHVVVTHVEWKSPAWKAGVRPGNVILMVNGKPAAGKQFRPVLENRDPEEKMRLTLQDNGTNTQVWFKLGEKIKKSFRISRISNPTELQKKIRSKWLNP